MISLDTAAQQLRGAWKMAFNHDDWRQALDRSMEAVFASFWAMVVTAPFLIMLSMLSHRAALKLPHLQDAPFLAAPSMAIVVSDIVAFGVEWIAGLAFLLAIARAGGASRNVADLIVGYNWIQPITIAAQAPAIAVLASTGDPLFASMLGLPALALSLTLYWGVIRRSFEIAAAQAVALIAVLFFIGITVDSLANGVLTAFFAP